MTFQKLRKRSKLSQEQVASILDVRQSTVSMWETGCAFPQSNRLKKLSELYRCSLEDLFKAKQDTWKQRAETQEKSS